MKNKEIRFNIYGWEIKHGSIMFGWDNFLKNVRGYKITKSRKDRKCDICHSKIEKGDLHGGTFYDHICIDCCFPDREKAEKNHIEKGIINV